MNSLVGTRSNMAAGRASERETVVSDVHLDTPFSRTEKGNLAFTRFKIAISSDSAGRSSEVETDNLDGYAGDLDQDGDLSPPRKSSRRETSGVVTIEHRLSTPLEDVGLQIWRGALLLCDFLIHNEERFDGCTALELGAGLGLCSIVMARVANRVLCTDIGANVLRSCTHNINLNSHLFKYGKDVVKVCELDWLKTGLSTSIFWASEDHDTMENVSVLLAADVIYDDSLTDAFLETVLYLLKPGLQRVLFIAIEKRLNFTLEDLDVVCPAYNHFIGRIKEFQTQKPGIVAKQLSTNFPNYLQYDRVKELVNDDVNKIHDVSWH